MLAALVGLKARRDEPVDRRAQLLVDDRGMPLVRDPRRLDDEQVDLLAAPLQPCAGLVDRRWQRHAPPAEQLPERHHRVDLLGGNLKSHVMDHR